MTQKLVSAEIPRRVLYRVEEAVLLLGLSRSQLYELIRSGRLQTVTEGRVRLIPAAAIDAYVSLLTSEAQADTGPRRRACARWSDLHRARRRRVMARAWPYRAPGVHGGQSDHPRPYARNPGAGRTEASAAIG